MNNYSSGYTLIAVLKIIGAVTIVISFVVGWFVWRQAYDQYLAFVVIVAGSVQGLILLGIGSIGEAILDGSIAQQRIAQNMDLQAKNKKSSSDTKIRNYKGYIIENKEGFFQIEGADESLLFESVLEAETWVDKKLNPRRR